MFSLAVAAGTALSFSLMLTAAPVAAQQTASPDKPGQIKPPEGFRGRRFADVATPNRLQVAPDGAVYVSQRDLGTLTLLKDLDKDGVADVQKVVAKAPNLQGMVLRGDNLFFETRDGVYSARRKQDGTLEKPRLLPKNQADAEPAATDRDPVIRADGSFLFPDASNNSIYWISPIPASADPTNTDSFPADPRITSQLDDIAATPATIQVTPLCFAESAPIPLQYSAYGEGISPAFQWENVPPGTKSLVLIMEDADALNPQPLAHWLVANISPKVKSLPRDIAKTEKPRVFGGGIQGGNFTGEIGYYGPKPSIIDPAHHYHFQIFALDTMLDLPSGFNRHALIAALRGHVLARGESVGTYHRE
jgi:Raf kinase inhibitor-like YbhB/YbcL family protein